MTDILQIASLIMLTAGFGAGVVFGISYNYNKIRKAGTVTTKKGTYKFTPAGQ